MSHFCYILYILMPFVLLQDFAGVFLLCAITIFSELISDLCPNNTAKINPSLFFVGSLK